MFSTLSETQKEIVYHKRGRVIVKACPGSGKTYTVASRLAYELDTWKFFHSGIACLSFTNVAWGEIENDLKCLSKITTPIAYPHFLGTIDSFINQFIFLPFGHLVMGCQKRPVLVGEPYGNWVGQYYSQSFFDKITFNKTGDLVFNNKTIKQKPNQPQTIEKILTEKKKLVEAGFATQQDANFFALKILEKYPKIATALVKRFPTLILDEAQDSSEMQMMIFDNLIKNGLNEVLFVGDPDQAIYEWNDARPDLFINKCQEWKDNYVELNESRRSSSNICSFTYKLSSLSNCPTALSPDVMNYDHKPEIIGYDNFKDVTSYFFEVCKSRDIDLTPSNVAILVRAKRTAHVLCSTDNVNMVQTVSLNNSSWDDFDACTKEISKGKYLFDHGFYSQGFKLIEKGYFKLYKNIKFTTKEEMDNVISDEGIILWRKKIYNLILNLPDTSSCCIGEWINLANEVITTSGNFSIKQVKKTTHSKMFHDIFALEEENTTQRNYTVGTVHSAKGQTFQAVLVILRERDKHSYKNLLVKNLTLQKEEELRIVYVGITRPRKILMLAVPKVDVGLWQNKFYQEKLSI